ncbi:MAG TPA: hypothetical protein VH724_04535 [Candidatus Angelobacter sp.]|nr:hypothetical protein [Candidatus Angelobacter sp.]
MDKAYAFLLVARAYSSFNAAEESRLLEESCKAAVTAPAEDLDVSFKEKIEYDCLQRLLVVRPAPAAELLSLAGANVRQQIMARKAPETAKKGDMDAAMEMLSSEISKGAEYPYDRAMAVLKALPPDDRADRDRIFAQALSLYRERHKRASAGMEDLGTMIVRFWRDLSPGLVLEGVNQLLDSAMDENVADSHLEVTVSLQSSAHSFGSLYQYRLFQLLPVLHALDPSSAARLMHDNQQPEWQHKVAPHDPMLSMTLSRKNGPAPVNSVANQDFAAIRLRMRAEEILASVKDDPALALARALSLDGDIDQGRSIKADVLTEIARITLKEHSEIASKSLEELSRAIESYPAIVRCRYLAESGNLYWRMQKTDKVRSVVAQGMKLVNDLYKEDSNSDDPNRALKSAWPSTVISRAFASLASRVSLKFAEETIAEVGDSDIQVFDRIEIASTLLAASSYPCLMQERHKQQNTYSMQVFAMPSTSN